ncbi:7-carboxy-7-deazaguanine synthase [Burkholderia phage BCSR5]|nr:7-carboxy-7-deazaguanine synthase [Burkholderia phage BCSR5]
MTHKTFPIVVQNVDRNVAKAEYDYILKPDELLVTSIFDTLQGEGPYAGMPAVFIRLSGCNYGAKSEAGACRFCDTSFQFNEGKVMSFDKIDSIIDTFRVDRRKRVLVITGGEPTLQHNLAAFLERVGDEYLAVQIETNGTQASFFELLDAEMPLFKKGDAESFWLSEITVVVSPKAVYKAGKYGKLSEKVLNRADYLKFVVDADPESPHHTIPDWAFAWAEEHGMQRLMVSPMAVYKKPYAGEVSSIWDDELINREATAANYRYAGEYALANNICLSLQQHLFVAMA